MQFSTFGRKVRAVVCTPYDRLRNYYPIWFHGYNRLPRHRFIEQRPQLNLLQQDIVRRLREDGFAHVSMRELFADSEQLFLRLREDVKKRFPSAQQDSGKPYLKMCWPRFGVLDMQNPFIQTTLQPVIIDTVNAYYQLWTKFVFLLWILRRQWHMVHRQCVRNNGIEIPKNR